MLKNDPEKKELKSTSLFMAEKALGTGETKMTSTIRFGSGAEIYERAEYLKGLKQK